MKRKPTRKMKRQMRRINELAKLALKGDVAIAKLFLDFLLKSRGLG